MPSKRQWNRSMSQTSSISRLQELLPQLFQSTHLPGDLYLRCQLTPEVTALLSMAYVQESLLVPGEQITPIPNMSPFVIGLMNSRERVFCAIDLAQLLGLSSPLAYSRQYHMVVIHVSQFINQQSTSEQTLLLGLVVNRIQGITRVMSDRIRSPQGNFPLTLTPYVRECVVEKDQQLPVLDIGAIANAPHLY